MPNTMSGAAFLAFAGLALAAPTPIKAGALHVRLMTAVVGRASPAVPA